jgi:hypothetical protein
MGPYLPLLACPLMMGVMGLVMWGMRSRNADQSSDAQRMTQMSDEIAELKSKLASDAEEHSNS